MLVTQKMLSEKGLILCSEYLFCHFSKGLDMTLEERVQNTPTFCKGCKYLDSFQKKHPELFSEDK